MTDITRKNSILWVTLHERCSLVPVIFHKIIRVVALSFQNSMRKKFLEPCWTIRVLLYHYVACLQKTVTSIFYAG